MVDCLEGVKQLCQLLLKCFRLDSSTPFKGLGDPQVLADQTSCMFPSFLLRIFVLFYFVFGICNCGLFCFLLDTKLALAIIEFKQLLVAWLSKQMALYWSIPVMLTLLLCNSFDTEKGKGKKNLKFLIFLFIDVIMS